MGSLGGQRRGGAARGDSSLVGDPSEVLARMVGEGVRKML